MARLYDSLFARLVANSEKPDDQNENGCWLYTGNVSYKGYGRVTMRKAGKDVWGDPCSKVDKILAHRAMEQIHQTQDAQLAADMAADDWLVGVAVEMITLDPDTQTIEHLCACRRCINPDHWIVVTRQENTTLMHTRIRNGNRKEVRPATVAG